MSMRESLLVCLLVIVAAILRVDYLLAAGAVIDSDEAIVGLMAKHFLAGQLMPPFYYGQHYMGSLEAYSAALLFSLFGAESFFLRLTPLLYSLATVPFLYLLVRRIDTQYGALVTTSLYAVAPPVLLVWSSKARGGFIEILFLGTLAFWLAACWYLSERPSRIRAALVGAVLGIGWWTNQQILYFMVPLGIVFLWRFLLKPQRGVWRPMNEFLIQSVFAIVGFLAGSLPFWSYNLQNDFASFGIASAVSLSDAWEHFVGLLLYSLPILFGAVRFWERDEVFVLARELVWGGLALLTLFWGGRLVTLLRGGALRLSAQHFAVFIGVCVISICLIFSSSSFGYLVEAPRYLLPMYIPIFVLIGIALSALRNRSRMLALVCWCSLLGWNVFTSYGQGRAIPGQPFVYDSERVQRDHRELHQWLEHNDIRAVRTNYWIGYRLSFESGERTIFSVFGEPSQVRIPFYEQQVAEFVAQDVDVPYLLLPKQAQVVRRALRLLGIHHQEAFVSGYVILFDLQDPLPIRRVRPAARFNVTSGAEAAFAAFDGLVQTRWGSGQPASPGMFFEIEFEEPQAALRGMEILMGRWPHDFARGLRVIVFGEQGERQVVLKPQEYEALLYLRSPDVEFRFAPEFAVKRVRLELTAGHHFFDWSIADIRFFEVEDAV